MLDWAKLMIYVVKNQIKYSILLNERPRDISLVRDQICSVYQAVNDMCDPTPLFKQHLTKWMDQ